MMSLSTGAMVALYVVLFFLVFWAFLTVGLLGAIAYALLKVRQQFGIALDKVDPVIAKSTDVLETVQRVTMNVGDKTDSLLARGEELASSLARKVDNTADVVQKTVTSPLINLSSLLAGLSRAFSAMGKVFVNGGRHSNGHRSNYDEQ